MVTTGQRQTITQEDLDGFKKRYPDDHTLQAMTLDEARAFVPSRPLVWKARPEERSARAAPPLSDCDIKVAYVIFDAWCLVTDTVELRANTNLLKEVVEAVAEAAAPALPQIKEIIGEMVSSDLELAKGVAEIIHALHKCECLEAVTDAVAQNLDAKSVGLLVLLFLKNIILALLTDGVSLVAEIAELLAEFAFLAADFTDAYQACKHTPPPAPPPRRQGPFPNGARINAYDSTPVPPAPCVFDKKLYLFWTANDLSHQILCSASADGRTWPRGAVVDPTFTTPSPPTPCVFEGKLYLFWRANDSSNLIYFSASADGTSWSAPRTVNGTDSTPDSVAAAVFEGKLYLFWRAYTEASVIYCSASADGEVWPAGVKIVDDDPVNVYLTRLAACTFKNSLRVFRVWVGPRHGVEYVIYSTSTDGTSWSNTLVDTGDHTLGRISACPTSENVYLFWFNSSIRFLTLAHGARALDAENINPTDTTFWAPVACVFKREIHLFWTAADSSNAICHSASALGGQNALPFRRHMAIQTSSGNFVTVENDGGSWNGAITTHLRTPDDTAKFTLVVVDQEEQTFALKTSGGYYVTAVDGGGQKGNGSIRTNATSIGAWEKLIFQTQSDGTCTISSTAGNFLAATNGGGVGNISGDAIQTTSTSPTPDGTFKLVVVEDSHNARESVP